jgi:hypothetical protein
MKKLVSSASAVLLTALKTRLKLTEKESFPQKYQNNKRDTKILFCAETFAIKMTLTGIRGSMKPITIAILLCILFTSQSYAESIRTGYHAFIVSSDSFSGTYSVNSESYTITPTISAAGYYQCRINLPTTGSYDFSITIDPTQRTTFILYYNSDLVADKLSSTQITYSASLAN